jgi:hypothetical protein
LSTRQPAEDYTVILMRQARGGPRYAPSLEVAQKSLPVPPCVLRPFVAGFVGGLGQHGAHLFCFFAALGSKRTTRWEAAH